MSLMQPIVQTRSGTVRVAISQIPQARAQGLSTESLRRQLFFAAAAAARGDDHKLVLLCQRHGRVIFGRTEIWSHVPPAFRGSPAMVNWYREGLRILGRFYADRLGRPKPLQQIKEAATVGIE